MHDGDAVWWDNHPWEITTAEAVIGQFPEPFLHGPDSKRLPVRIECADPNGPACRTVQDRLVAIGVPASRARLAAQLETAWREQRPIPQISATHPALTVGDAYAIQQRVVAGRLTDGARVVGWKIGLTSLAMQQQLGVDQPDYGPILDGWLVPNGGTVDASALIASEPTCSQMPSSLASARSSASGAEFSSVSIAASRPL